jgi:uncharacterized membrane protein
VAAVTQVPRRTLYHRSVGWHASAMKRAATAVAVGTVVGLGLLPIAPWELTIIGGWDAAALTFLAVIWPIVLRADSDHTEILATQEDETGTSAAVLLVGASTASLLGVGFTLGLAGHSRGAFQVLLILVAVLTVMLSWTVINTVYMTHYARQYFESPAEGVVFGDGEAASRPDYRDFAYMAFTIGMTYQVSDTTVRRRTTRRSVLAQALLSYVFGVVIVAGAINLIAGLLR